MADDGRLNRQFSMAWEHFKFHAEQRIKFFHFFLITSALLINAYSILIRFGEAANHDQYAFLLLWIGGILSATFIGLDVRNTQLLEQSEAILRKLERECIYQDWMDTVEIDGTRRTVPLGILSREEKLKQYLEGQRYNRWPWKWFAVNNIKHKSSLRFMYVVSLLSFWLTAIATRPTGTVLPVFGEGIAWIEWVLFGVCGVWAVYAMLTPARDLRREACGAATRRSRSEIADDPTPR